MKQLFASLIIVFLISSCSTPEKISCDLIVHGGTIYTVNETQPIVEMVATNEGKIIFAGTMDRFDEFKGPNTKVIDLQGKTMTPGFIESHAHIMGVGFNLLNVDLMQVKSYEELVNMVSERAAETPKGEWILGRGWHQDKWDEQPESKFKGFPTHHLLSQAVPDHPVLLAHASGHMSLANAKAMEMAGITSATPQPQGGEIFLGVDGKPTGIFNETADLMLEKKVPPYSQQQIEMALDLAIGECLKNGITSFHNAGADTTEIDLFKAFAENDKLKIRLYTMLNGRDSLLLKKYFNDGPEIALYDDHLTVRSIKLYADGALGSRGAWLLEEYEDAPGKYGHNVMPMEDIANVTRQGYENGFQICVHAIGDRANQEVLDIYDSVFTNYEGPSDHRFRIEHAQHIDGDDIPRFAELGVIAAMQAIHMSSDRPWAIDRLGKDRIEEGAYVWQKLLASGAKVVNGTDAPVEPISPVASFYSSVTRMTLNGNPEGGFEPSQKMTPEQALKTYTLDAAYAAFEENSKGSIEVGKLADFTIFSQDLLKVSAESLLSTQVEMTIIGGKVLFERN